MKYRFEIYPNIKLSDEAWGIYKMQIFAVHAQKPNGSQHFEHLATIYHDSVEWLKDESVRIMEAARMEPIIWEKEL